MKLGFISGLLVETVREWQADQASRLAAALAYYTTFSLAPLLVLVIAIAGLAGGRQAAQGLVMQQVQDLLGVRGREFVQGMIEAASVKSNGLAASVIGTATLLIGALGVFTELQNSLNRIWDVKPDPRAGVWAGVRGFLLKRLLSFSMLLGIGFLLLVFLVISAVLAALGETLATLPASQWTLQALNMTLSFGIITLLFALIFKFIPDAKVAWREVWPGAALTALLFTAGKYLIGLYLGSSTVGSAFGAAGSLALIMVWVYYSSQILFFGAEFTQVFAKRMEADLSE